MPAQTPAGLPLLAWLSPAFPVGAFAYSHGLEAAVEAGALEGVQGLGRWIDDLIEHGSVRADALLLAAAWRAVAAQDEVALREVSDLAQALCAGRERRLETTAMGNAFLATLRSAWPGALPPQLVGDVAYPVAVGMASAAADLALSPTLEAYALAFVGNLVSAAVRLGVIGQTDAQRLTMSAIPRVQALAVIATAATLDDLGACAFRADIAALQHEIQYSRLFRS